MDDPSLGDERVDELNTLQSIYPELVLDLSHPATPTAHIELPVAPAKPLSVTFEPETMDDKLSYLPPLLLEIILAEGYPAQRPPQLKLATDPAWLPDNILRTLEEEGEKQWEEYGRMQVLYTYISWLQEQAEAAFGIVDALPDGVLRLPASQKDVFLSLNERLRKEVFDHETFDCGICLEPKKGSACYQLRNCGHVFCRACLQDYYGNCITEGGVNNVRCTDPGCGKTGDVAADHRRKERLISPAELLQIPLPKEQVVRYAQIKRKKKIESDPSIVFCPRQWCQGPMRTAKYPKITDVALLDDEAFAQFDTNGSTTKDADGNLVAPERTNEEKRMLGAPGTDRLSVCELCNFAFCRTCLASWHGDHVRCLLRTPKDLTEEEQASMNYILANTSACPTCSVPCQKSYGCNHMSCAQCQTHFCYLCGAWLEPGNPYRHFNDPKNKGCFQRLMEGAMGDGGDVRFGGRRGAEQEAAFWEEEVVRLQAEEFARGDTE